MLATRFLGMAHCRLMQLIAHGQTDVGRARAGNEDYFVIDPELGLYVVCDGMGGHASGEVASKTTAEAVIKYVREHRAELTGFDGSQGACTKAAELLRVAIEDASSQVFQMAQSKASLHGMGTTCVALLFVGEKVVMGHVGDSRVYLVRNGTLHQLSEDHTYANDAIKHGMMTPEQAHASRFAEMITRAIGVQSTVVVDTFAFDVVVDDTFLLCSDGLYEYFKKGSELSELLSERDPAAIPGKLVELANERGGKDNITSLIVRTVPSNATAAKENKRKTLIDDELSVLRHLDLFMELTMAELVRVLVAFRVRKFDAGVKIINEGSDASSMFVLVAGEVEVSRKGETIANLLVGQHFGDMALLDHRPRTATVVSKTPVRTLEFTRESFNDLMVKEPALGAKILFKLAQILSIRLEDAMTKRAPNAAVTTGDVGRNPRSTMDITLASPFQRARAAKRRT
jgi:serine/threonine protein phosphatase PrpC